MPDNPAETTEDIPSLNIFQVSKKVTYKIEDPVAFSTVTADNASLTGMNPRKTRRKPSTRDHNDPTTRVSVFTYIFPLSKESEWVWYDPVGWVHHDELSKFTRIYGRCAISDQFVLKDSMVKFYSKNMGMPGLASSHLMSGGKYVYTVNGYWSPIEDTIEARNYDCSSATGFNLVHVHKEMGSGYRTCDFDGTVWTSESFAKIRKSDSYKMVARKYINGHDFVCCNECGSNFESDHMISIEDGESEMCVSCHTSWQIKQTIKPHNHTGYPKVMIKPIMRFPVKKSISGLLQSNPIRSHLEAPRRLFGVEVETEMHAYSMMKANVFRYHVARDLLDTLGQDFVMAKEDGSLLMNGKYSDGDTGAKYAGFELVTAPADLQSHYERWPLIATSKYYGMLRSWNTETCGFHVHVSRDGMSALQIARIVLFVNHKRNKLFIQKVAGRGSAKYCKYFDKEPKDTIGVHYKNDENRRQAVNLTNEKTIEFRIFRGTVNPKHILRNIEFCDAICDFCYPASRPLSHVNDRVHFLNFVEENKKRWPLLAAWLALHGFISVDIPEERFRKDMSIKMDSVPESEILVDDSGNTVKVPALETF